VVRPSERESGDRLTDVVVAVVVVEAAVPGFGLDGLTLGSSPSGKAPGRSTGSETPREGNDAGTEVVAVFDETVVDDAFVASDSVRPKGSVVDDIVWGLPVALLSGPASPRIATSPVVGGVPRYRSAKT